MFIQYGFYSLRMNIKYRQQLKKEIIFNVYQQQQHLTHSFRAIGMDNQRQTSIEKN